MGLLRGLDAHFVTNKWIGVSGGYLGDFSYRTHKEFYPTFCDIEDIDPDELDGTTRQRFEKILIESEPWKQAKILRGVLEKYPTRSAEHRTQTLYDKMQELIARCEGAAMVAAPKPIVKLEVVERAFADAETLLQNGRAVSAVDRLHTAFHGYLLSICDDLGIACERDASITKLFKLLRMGYDKLKPSGPFAEQIDKMLNALSVITDCLNPLRNRGSIAHPNENLLEYGEAMLFINTVRTLLHFMNTKIGKSGS